MKTTTLCTLAAGLGAGATLTLQAAVAAPHASQDSPESMLRSFVEDFRSDRAASEPRTFGFRVTGEDGGDWTIAVRGDRASEDSWKVDLLEGLPAEPTFAYVLDADTLADVHAGYMNGLTAQGKAYPGDPTPIEVEWLNGADQEDINAFSFHFWTTGFPEQVPFDRSLAREVHGANNVVFYYQPGFRSAWTSLEKGSRVDNGAGGPMLIPFPMMVIGVKGRAQGLVDGHRVESGAGQMTFIPANTPYMWWNEDDEPSEAVLVWFGEGA